MPQVYDYFRFRAERDPRNFNEGNKMFEHEMFCTRARDLKPCMLAGADCRSTRLNDPCMHASGGILTPRSTIESCCCDMPFGFNGIIFYDLTVTFSE